mmetsp:Transcript_2589/g.6872  ORF Transcript_2589/g.6872 Transcript_2589/m.6872 type:complete len:124 (+) Transcript_2589:34-405(+)
MVPKYTGEPEEDLLTAIRYDDYDKMIECIETRGVDVNHKWVTRQNQSPLLAAAGRMRSRMLEYLLKNGADKEYINDGQFNALMYTYKTLGFDDDLRDAQLKLLEKYGTSMTLSPEQQRLIEKS